jgi:hypothetical protein
MPARTLDRCEHRWDPGAICAGRGYVESDRGYGWVLFAATLLLTLGFINSIEKIAAIGNSHFFVGGTHYIVGSLHTWGWVVLWIGVIQWCVAVGVFVKNQFSR